MNEDSSLQHMWAHKFPDINVS